VNLHEEQRGICDRVGADYLAPASMSKVGIALATLDLVPLNALRHPPEGGTCGWYIWGGEVFPSDVDDFQVLHVEHLNTECAKIVPYLALAPGWRVLLAPDYEDVWYDASLLYDVNS
jgi:hypothetical protein